MKYRDIRKELLSDNDVEQAYASMEVEYKLIESIIDARNELHITQQELANRTGINRADLSRIENGNANPSLKTLKRIAAGLGKKLEIRIV